MANIQITTTQKQDNAIQYMTDVYNKNHPGAPLAPSVFFKQTLDIMLDSWTTAFDESQRLGKGQLYQKATPEDQLAIDIILEKYK